MGTSPRSCRICEPATSGELSFEPCSTIEPPQKEVSPVTAAPAPRFPAMTDSPVLVTAAPASTQ
eukprot:1589056-Rhodomonas_salina.2